MPEIVTFEDAENGAQDEVKDAVVEALTLVAQRFDVFVASTQQNRATDETAEARETAYIQAQKYLFRAIDKYEEGKDLWYEG